MTIDWLAWLCTVEDDPAYWQNLPAQRWIDIARQAERHQLAPLLYHQIRALHLEVNLPAAALQRLRYHYVDQIKISTRREHELVQALQALSDVAVTPVLFKGAALAHTIYPTPACRPMVDLDLWMAATEMARAQSALENCGYVQRMTTARPQALQAKNYGEIQLYGSGPDQGVIELHWGVFPGEWLRRTARVDHAEVWARCVPLTVLGHTVRGLSPEDQLLQLAVHQAISHQMSEPHGRGLADVVRLARSAAQPIDWDVIVARARAWRVSTVVWLVLHLASELTGWNEAESSLRRLAPSAARQWLLRRFVNPRAFLAGQTLLTNPLRFGYLLCLVDSPRALVQLVGRTLWPEADWLKWRYGQGGTLHRARLRHLVTLLSGKM